MNIEQTVSAAVADLRLGHTFTIDDLVHAIQVRRQRTLRVHELQDLDTSDGLCAIWLIGETKDSPTAFGLFLRSTSLDSSVRVGRTSDCGEEP